MPIRSLATFAAALIAGTALAAYAHAEDPELAGPPAMAPPAAPPEAMEGPHAYHHPDFRDGYAREEAPEYAEGPEEYAPPPEGPGPGWCPMMAAPPEVPAMEEHHAWERRVCGGRIGFHHGHARHATHRRFAHAHHAWHEPYRLARTEHSYRRVEREETFETEALPPPPPPPRPMIAACPQVCAHHVWPKPTTFETGYIDWPGKVHFGR